MIKNIYNFKFIKNICEKYSFWLNTSLHSINKFNQYKIMIILMFKIKIMDLKKISIYMHINLTINKIKLNKCSDNIRNTVNPI